MESAEISRESTESLGAPALQAGGLRLWLHGRQFPHAHDPDEGNLIRATILCEGEDVSVRAEDAGIRASDIARWAKNSRALLEGNSTLARLTLKKKVFEIVLKATDHLETVHMHVAVVPGDGVKAQSFEFDLFRHELKEIVRQCDQILSTYPVRGASLPEEV
jgi:hypothetical protein